MKKNIGLFGKCIIENGEILTSQQEIDTLVDSVKKTKGNIAEVGMYQGGSAEAMCIEKGDRNFYGFETFEGIPMVENAWRLGAFKSDEEFVRNRLSKYPNVFITKGIFPDNTDLIDNKKFSVVHLDVDTTEGTRDGLNYFKDNNRIVDSNRINGEIFHSLEEDVS